MKLYIDVPSILGSLNQNKARNNHKIYIWNPLILKSTNLNEAGKNHRDLYAIAR